jgi:hypothetical protein
VLAARDSRLLTSFSLTREGLEAVLLAEQAVEAVLPVTVQVLERPERLLLSLERAQPVITSLEGLEALDRAVRAVQGLMCPVQLLLARDLEAAEAADIPVL